MTTEICPMLHVRRCDGQFIVKIIKCQYSAIKREILAFLVGVSVFVVGRLRSLSKNR